MADAGVWSAFPHDPRDSAHASLRAADADRDRIVAVLATAYAEGRIDREELDQRQEAVSAARTLGELPPIVADLVPERTPARRPIEALATASPTELRDQAVDCWRDQRRSAAFGLATSAIVVWTIWFLTGHDYFPWPLIVNAFALLNLVRTQANRRAIIEEELRRLEKRQAKALRRRHWRP